MNDDDADLGQAPGYDFHRLCRVFKVWYDQHGLSQSRIEEAGGPSGPIITKLYNESWISNRPRAIADKIDRGLGWPPRTAWSVLVRSDPIAGEVEEEERQLRATFRNRAAASTRPGTDRARREREVELARFELEQFLNRQAAAVIAWIDRSVGGDVKDDRSYVESPGNRVEGGEHGDATARAIEGMREELRALAERQAASFDDLSARVERLERQQSAEPVDGSTGARA